MTQICFLSAAELVRRIAARELSVHEVMLAHLERIERVNPGTNAIVTLLPERALRRAAAADVALARGGARGPLFGLPIAHKDLVSTRGMRTTFGSPIFAEHVPAHDALIVERLRDAGAIAIGKTNVPEFGAGAQTYNEVFGATRNPYDTQKTCGGSSGGAAVALATGMVPIADGSDLGGSLRNPANFCNVVGFRTSPGRVPRWPTSTPRSTLSVLGPMARSVEDAALLLSAMAGPDARSPIALAESGEVFGRPLERDFEGVRVAFGRDLGGLPVDPRVSRVLEASRPVFCSLGCVVEDAEPDWRDADFVFKTLRAWQFRASYGDLLERHRDRIKETLVWNIEQGRRLTPADLARAETLRSGLDQRVREFMRERSFMVLPVNQVPPFDVKELWVTEIDGTPMETYIDWMRSCYYVSSSGLPAISVPAGFTDQGLPVGIQIVGRHQDDFGVLQLAHAFERATGCARRRPPEPD